MTKNDRYNVKAGWLVDGSGAPARHRVFLQIAGGRIVRIDAAENAPPQGRFLDFSADTVLPCLVDSHVHLFMSGTTDPQARKQQLCADFNKARRGIAQRIGRHIAFGVAAVRDGGDAGGRTLDYRKMHAAREFPRFTLRAAGRAWRSEGRYGRLIGRPPENGMSLADSIAAEADGTDHVKIVNSGLNSLISFGRTTRPQFSAEALSEAVRSAGRLGLKVMVHANGPEAVTSAVEAGCHSIEHGFFMGTEAIEKMAERGTVWIPTVVTMKACAASLGAGSREAAGAARNLDHQLGQIEAARRLGAAVAVGSDAGSIGVHHGSGCVEEMKLLCAAGYTIEEVVRCASVLGARLLGLERTGGRLAPGRPASFLVCPGAPNRLPDSLYRLKALYVEGGPVLTAEAPSSIQSC